MQLLDKQPHDALPLLGALFLRDWLPDGGDFYPLGGPAASSSMIQQEPCVALPSGALSCFCHISCYPGALSSFSVQPLDE